MSRKRVIMFLAGLGLAILLIVLVSKAHVVAVTRYTVEIAGLPPAFDGFQIMHLTDLHSNNYGDKQEGLV